MRTKNQKKPEQDSPARIWANEYFEAITNGAVQQLETAMTATKTIQKLSQQALDPQKKAFPEKSLPFLKKNPFLSSRSFEENYMALKGKSETNALDQYKNFRHRLENVKINTHLLTLLSEKLTIIQNAPPEEQPYLSKNLHMARENKNNVKKEHLKDLQSQLSDFSGIFTQQKTSLETRVDRTKKAFLSLDSDGTLADKAKNFDLALDDYTKTLRQEITALADDPRLSNPQAIFDLFNQMLEDDINRLYDTWENEAKIVSLSAAFLNTHKNSKKKITPENEKFISFVADKFLMPKLEDLQKSERILTQYFTAVAQSLLKEQPLFAGGTFHKEAAPFWKDLSL